MKYTIREISDRYGLNQSTLRYYEEMGLLEGVSHDKNGKRSYNDKHLERLDGVMCFKRAGMSISQIKQYYDLEKNMGKNIDSILALINSQKADMEQQLVDLQASLDHINEKVYFYGLVKKAVDSKTKIPTWDEVFNKGEKK